MTEFAALATARAATASAAILALHEALLASASATAVLRERFGDPVEIERLQAAFAVDAALLSPLDVADRAEIVHRRVRLHAGGLAVSEADLWYVPARLLAGMADRLASSAVPFGAVVAPMRPRRENLWWEFGAPGAVFALEHRAVLRDRTGLAIAAVHERYFARACGDGGDSAL